MRLFFLYILVTLRDASAAMERGIRKTMTLNIFLTVTYSVVLVFCIRMLLQNVHSYSLYLYIGEIAQLEMCERKSLI